MRISYINEKDAFDAWKKIKKSGYRNCKVMIQKKDIDNSWVKIQIVNEMIILPIDHRIWENKTRITFHDIETRSGMLCELLKGCTLELYYRNFDNIRFGDSETEMWMDTVIIHGKHLNHRLNLMAWNGFRCIEYLD